MYTVYMISRRDGDNFVYIRIEGVADRFDEFFVFLES